MWVYVALSAIAGALLQCALLKFIVLILNSDITMDFVKRMILYHHKLKNPNRAKELNEVEE